MKIWLFPCLSAIIGSPVHLPTLKMWEKNNNPVHFYFWLRLSLSLASLWKKTSRLDFAPPVPLKGDVIIILSPLNLHVSTHGTAIVFSLATTVYISSNATAKVRAKHTYCSVFGCTDEYRTLFRVPASEETREQWIYWFIYCILSCCHTDLI